MASVVFTKTFHAVFDELRPRDQALILAKCDLLEAFPELYKLVRTGEFRGCHVFAAGDWLVYYKVRSGTVYLRNLWPARIPYRR